jgi:uncharacterized protein YycO
MQIEKTFKIASISLLLMANCSFAMAENVAESATETATSPSVTINNLHEKDALRVLTLIEQSQGLRKQLPLFFAESKQAIKAHNGALPASYSSRLAKALLQANEMRDGLFDQALRHRSALYRVDTQLSDADRTAEIIIGMAAAVTLYDNHQITNDALAGNALLRDKLNEAYPELGVEGGYLSASNIRALNPEYRKAMNDAVQYFNDNKPAITQQINQGSPTIQALYQTVAQSLLIKKLHASSVFKQIIVLPFKVVKGTADGVTGLSDIGLKRIKFTGSKVAGNTMGMVRWREGKLKNDAQFLQIMQSQLQPGDILLEKTPFTLTDKSIPGHFGHAALYTGTAEQLKALGANSPFIQKNIANITAGHTVVEALRGGVQLNPLQRFMNIDDVAVLRPKYLNQQEKIDAVNLALGNLGKQYDFNFDVNTTETIVCSELIYIVYPQIDFVTKRVLGSFAITPDDVAMQAGFEQDPLAVVLFAHDGKMVLDNSVNENGLTLYNQLVKGDNKQAGAQKLQAKNTFLGFIK